MVAYTSSNFEDESNNTLCAALNLTMLPSAVLVILIQISLSVMRNELPATPLNTLECFLLLCNIISSAFEDLSRIRGADEMYASVETKG